MKTFREIITNFRDTKNETLLESFKFTHNGETEYGKIFDVNYWNRKDLIFELFDNYTLADKPLIKWLLNEEFKGYESEADLPVYTIDLCAFMLYKHMEMVDIYDLFKVKFGAGTDNQCFVDIELVLGFDSEQTKQYLLNNPTNKRLNKQIVKAINWYVSQPEHKLKDRVTYINYFESRKIRIIKNDMEDTEKYIRNILK